MNKIVYLVTTKGCQACRVQRNNLNIAIEDYDIEYKECDFTELPDWLQTNVVLTDFPVTIFIEDEVIKYHFSGTKSVNKLNKILRDLNF